MNFLIDSCTEIPIFNAGYYRQGFVVVVVVVVTHTRPF